MLPRPVKAGGWLMDVVLDKLMVILSEGRNCYSAQLPAFGSMVEIKVRSQLAGTKAIEAELTWVDCGASSERFMNLERRTTEIRGKRGNGPLTTPTQVRMCVCMT